MSGGRSTEYFTIFKIMSDERFNVLNRAWRIFDVLNGETKAGDLMANLNDERERERVIQREKKLDPMMSLTSE